MRQIPRVLGDEKLGGFDAEPCGALFALVWNHYWNSLVVWGAMNGQSYDGQRIMQRMCSCYNLLSI